MLNFYYHIILNMLSILPFTIKDFCICYIGFYLTRVDEIMDWIWYHRFKPFHLEKRGQNKRKRKRKKKYQYQLGRWKLNITLRVRIFYVICVTHCEKPIYIYIYVGWYVLLFYDEKQLMVKRIGKGRKAWRGLGQKFNRIRYISWFWHEIYKSLSSVTFDLSFPLVPIYVVIQKKKRRRRRRRK